MRIHRRQLIAFPTMVAVVACLAACTVGPDYVKPEISVPDVWRARAVAGVEEGGASIQTWWESLDDPTLTDLLRRAQRANLDLEIAVARIREARALHRIAKGDWYPGIDAQGSAGLTGVHGCASSCPDVDDSDDGTVINGMNVSRC